MGNGNPESKRVSGVTDIASVLASVGEPRLAPYKIFFQCQTEAQLLGAYFWGQAIGGAFYPKYWGNLNNVAELIGMLKNIQDLRNAVAHHEPIWKRHRLKGSETHWSHSVVSLREKHADILTVMAWCCPHLAAATNLSFATRLFKSICSTNAVRAFMDDPCGAGAMTLFEPPLPDAASRAESPPKPL